MRDGQFEMFEARKKRDDGMALSLENAESKSPGWKEVAYAFLLDFARRKETFISEDVSDASKILTSFPQPPTDRAWGSIYRKACNNRIIIKQGTGISRRRHASICPLWRSLVYGPKAL